MSAKSKSGNFKKGEQVQARWAGSKKFYDGKIVDVLKTICKVQFDNDGSISSVKLADIKKPDKSAEEKPVKPTRSKTRSRSRSAGRPPRSKSRSVSRSPARKMKVKTEKSREKSVEKKSTDTNSSKKDELDSVPRLSLAREKVSKPELTSTITLNSFVSKSIAAISKEESLPERAQAIKRLSTLRNKEDSFTERARTTKRLSALRSMESTQRMLDTKHANAKLSEKAKYSDDEEEEEDVVLPKKTLSRLWQVLYFLGTSLKIILVPGFLLFLIFACGQKSCTILEVPNFFTRWNIFLLSIQIPLVCITLFHGLLCLLPHIPVGKKVTGFPSIDNKTPLEYRLHGFVYLLCSMLIFGICAFFGVTVTWASDKFKVIALCSFFYSFVFTLFMYVLHAVKGEGPIQSKVPLIGKLYNGSFTNPILFNKIDVKTSFIQAGLIGSVLLNMSILAKHFLVKGTRCAIPLFLTSGMQIFFVLDLLFREEKLLSSATYTSDSVGYAFMITTGFLIPLGLSFQNVYHYHLETKIKLNPYWNYSAIAAIVILFFIGYYIYLTSSNLKHNYRKDPRGKIILNIDSIATLVPSKRLIVSGGWGLVRHPNYLGVLMMAIAWTLPCGFTHVAPFGPLVILAIGLVIRIFRIESECHEKYGPGWKTYTEKVRSRLIPYIF